MDTINIEIGISKVACAFEGLKCDSLIPTKYHYVCTSSDEIKVIIIIIKFKKIKRKQILFNIN